MSVWQRIGRVLRARSMVTALRDPVTVLRRAVEVLQRQAALAREAAEAREADARRYADGWITARRDDQRMLARARRAITRGEDGLAREAARQHLQATACADQQRRLWEQAQRHLTWLRRWRDTLEARADVAMHRLRLLEDGRQAGRTHRMLLDGLAQPELAIVPLVEETMMIDALSVEAYQELDASQVAERIDTLDAGGDPIERVLRRLREEMSLPSNASARQDGPHHAEGGMV